MVHLIYETHATSIDNENQVASGWFDIQLSVLGKQQAKEMGVRYKNKKIDIVFCSDLERAHQTAVIAFGTKSIKILTDWRLRECNYGNFTQRPSQLVEKEKLNRITVPFPDGESYGDCIKRTSSFLADLKSMFDGMEILIIGHAATRHCLDFLINGRPVKDSLSEKFDWQPGWDYELK